MSQDRFSNPKYIDWLKEKLCLQYAKEGLEPITERQVQTFHTSLSSRLQAPSSSCAKAVSTLCHSCFKTDLKKQWARQRFSCLGGICDGWLDLLQQNHVDPTSTVEWDNVDVSQLPVSAWECAKVYLPHGSGKVQCAGDADLAAILTLYLNCRPFVSSMQDVTLCDMVKDVRNRLLYSGTMEVEHSQMLSDVGVIKQLLNDPAFAADTSCQGAITKICKLVGDKQELSQNKELELVVLNSDIKSVADKSGQFRHDMNDLTDQVQQQYGQLGTEVSRLTTEVSSLKDKINVSTNDKFELHKIADLLCSFINACHIDKADMEQLLVSISTLSTLRCEVGRQAQVLAQLQEKVGRHDVRLNQHERQLNMILADIKAKTGLRDRDNPEIVDLDALQQYLVDLYKDDCVWINPVPASVETDEPATISQMYVKPEMKVVRQKGQKVDLDIGMQRQVEPKPIPLSYRDIFYADTEQCKNIYVTGNAGMGKTTFCKQLVYTWCKAVQNIAEKGDSPEDLSLLREFKLLFYVNLREVESQYHIEDMIRDNVLHNARTAYNVTDLLKTEKYLVVLDGLDEWSRPEGAKICRGLNKDIPGRNIMHKNCFFLTTTRNWKFDVIDLKSTTDCDCHVELCGIGEHSAEELARKTISNLNPDTNFERAISDFFEEVKKKNIDPLKKVPILLIHLVTLWYFCKDLGKSQLQLYCRMLDMLLEQAKKHLHEKTSIMSKPVQTDIALPECFTEEEDSCHNHAQLLLCLSKLAFMSLLNKKKEDSLVFKSTKLDICGIDSLDISLCLKCGILTQNKVLGNPLGRYKKYSFLHKKLQEFLAAVYLVTSDDVGDNMRQVREYCNKLDTTLEMGQVFMFVCGMKAEVGKQLLDHLTSVVSNDASVQKSKQSIGGQDLIMNIHTCVMTCVAEGASMGLTYKVCLQDYVIDDYHIIFNQVVEKKNTSIRSVYILPSFLNSKHVTVVLKHLQRVTTLEKLWLRDSPYTVSDINILAPVLTSNISTLKSLFLSKVNLAPHKAMFTAVLNCIPSLRTLGLGVVGLLDVMSVSHCQIKQLLAVTTSNLTHLHLGIYYNNHCGQCGPVLDLSHHPKLQTIVLWYMCVTKLHSVEQSVEKVDLIGVTVTQNTLRQFIEALAQSSNKVEVKLHLVTVLEDSGSTAGLVAYLSGCDKFTIDRCAIGSRKQWFDVKFHKK